MSEPHAPTTEDVKQRWLEAHRVPASLGSEQIGHLRQQRLAEFDVWLAKVKAEAVREHEEKRVVIHMDPPQPRLVPVPAPCPRCGWSR